MSEQIKPCLFCGGDAEPGNTGVWWVQCCNPGCSAEGPARRTKAEAIAAWNEPARPEPTLADVLIAEWRGRAEVAERASAHKEHLLTLQSAALTKQERIVLAVGIKVEGSTPAAIYIQSNSGDEVETLARLSKSIGPYMELLALTIREEAGKRAGAALGASTAKVAGLTDAWAEAAEK